MKCYCHRFDSISSYGGVLLQKIEIIEGGCLMV